MTEKYTTVVAWLAKLLILVIPDVIRDPLLWRRGL